MYNIVKLNNKMLGNFKILEKENKVFNPINEDFFKLYNNSNFTQQLFMRRRTLVLLDDKGTIIGFIWFTNGEKTYSMINSMFVLPTYDITDCLSILISKLPSKITYSYFCERNLCNFETLEKIGFKKMDGTLEMHCKLDNEYIINSNPSIEFEQLVLEEQEDLRCDIQNQIFKKDNRVPLTLQDIFFDEQQEYYFEKGAIFIKYNGQYIGYGQIIFEDNTPVIVNFGIIKEFRNKGFAKILLKYLLNMVRAEGYENILLKVSSENYPAINLYTKIGFRIQKETIKWILQK